MAALTKWRSWRFGAVFIAIFIQVVNGYEEAYRISQLSPKSAVDDRNEESLEDTVLKTSQTANLAFRIEPSALFEEPDFTHDIIEEDERRDERHFIIARSADPIVRESRSLNIDEIPSSNNEIDNDLELHNKRKYYDIHPTKTVDYLHSKDDVILSSEGFGDKLEFRFPGEEKRVPYGRALTPMGPRIRPTAVQPIFATASLRDEGRQNTEIQNIITGIVKLLNGNVNVQANTQLLGRPSRPMASRINNRGPPRISDVPPLPDFDKPLAPIPQHSFVPTKTPPPYPFDRPPVHVNLPEQIVPPLVQRPGLHRPMPPWQRPRPPNRPNRRPNPGLPMYKPNLPIIHYDIPEMPEEERPEEVSASENETVHSENVIHHEETNIPEVATEVATEYETTSTTTTEATTELTTTTQRTTTTGRTTTTEKAKEKPVKIEKDKKKDTPAIEKEKPTKFKPEEKTTQPNKVEETTEKIVKSTETNIIPEVKVETTTKTEEKVPQINKKPPENNKIDQQVTQSNKNELPHNDIVDNILQNNTNKTLIEQIIESSLPDTTTSSSSVTPTPTEGLVSQAPVVESSSVKIESSSINSQPFPPSQGIPYQPYRPRPGIVLDDTDFKPHGSRYRPEPAVITAATERMPGYGEIFDVTVSAIQGPGKQGASVHIENINLSSHEHDIIVSASGDQGFVSIDGKRTYLNLFDSSTAGPTIAPTRVQTLPQSSVPITPPPSSPTIGQGVAIPADDTPLPPPARRPQNPHIQTHGPPGNSHSGHGLPGHSHSGQHRPQQGFRRPQPTVRIDTCIVGDDSTCDQAQNEKCRTEAGISSCQCRPSFARRSHRDPCRRVVALLLNLRVDRLYDRKVVWDTKLADKESEPYQQLSYEAIRAIDSAFSMTPFSDDFVSSSVNMVHKGDENNKGVFVNYTILMQETAETLSTSIGTEIQKHMLGVIRRRSNNVGASALWVDSVHGSVLPLHDVDECSSPDLNDCHQLATCTNTWGGFKCSCPDTTLDPSTGVGKAGRECRVCPASHCSDRGTCRYANGQPYCSCTSGYYGSRCEVDGEVVGVAVGASLVAALVIAVTLAALLSWSRKWSREQKAAGMGSPVFNYMASNTIKTPPVGQPPYQVTMEERLRWAQIAEAMVANHYAPEAQTMATRPSSAMFGAYPTLPPVPLPRMGLHGHHNGTLNTAPRNNTASHHNLYGYTNHMATESTSSEASSHVQERADLLVPRPKSRARSMHNQTGIYYDVDYENAPEPIYGSKGIPLSTYTVSRGPPFYR